MPMTRAGSISDMSQDDLRKLIRDEVSSIIKEEVGDRLSRLEDEVAKLTAIPQKVSALEVSADAINVRIDELYTTAIPAINGHIEKIANALALQTLDIDMHRRKWSITIQGLAGPANEDESTTRDACVRLARTHLGITDAAANDFAACHRLKPAVNAGIIARFNDLAKRNAWLANAKNLKNSGLSVSIAPDLPPKIRPLKTELLNVRKDMSPDQKRQATVRYLKQWPYVQLKCAGDKIIKPSLSQRELTTSILGFDPLCLGKDPAVVE